MNAFEIFMARSSRTITKAALEAFMAQNRSKVAGPIAESIQALDKAITVNIAPHADGTNPVPVTKADQNNYLTARNGSKDLDITFGKVQNFLAVLQALSRIFDTSLTGAFEIPDNRAPGEHMRYTFATTKFVTDHIAPYNSKSDPALIASAKAVAKRRMITSTVPAGGGPAVPAFTTISTSSTMALNTEKIRKGLEVEIASRQKEFEAIYRYLTSQNNRLLVLMQGEHEEVVFTTTGKYKFYEATRPATPTNDPIVTTYADNYLRYSVQKVGSKWLLHHMAGRIAPGEAAVAPNTTYQAFDYAHLQGIAAVTGTFSKIG